MPPPKFTLIKNYNTNVRINSFLIDEKYARLSVLQNKFEKVERFDSILFVFV